MTLRRVAVDVATVWVDPSSPRDDRRPRRDHSARPRRLEPDWTQTARFGLHERTETQVLQGEPVEVFSQVDGWTQIAAPWQPSPKHPRGYPGWIRTDHLDGHRLVEGEPGPPAATMAADHVEILDLARTFAGVPYLWGGTSPWGFDCSGVVHYCYRQAGIVIPRDANAQEDASEPIPLGSERPGDLYFFARPGKTAHHIGFVTGRLSMLHAPEDGAAIEEVPLSESRIDVLTGAGRIPL